MSLQNRTGTTVPAKDLNSYPGGCDAFALKRVLKEQPRDIAGFRTSVAAFSQSRAKDLLDTPADAVDVWRRLPAGFLIPALLVWLRVWFR